MTQGLEKGIIMSSTTPSIPTVVIMQHAFEGLIETKNTNHSITTNMLVEKQITIGSLKGAHTQCS